MSRSIEVGDIVIDETSTKTYTIKTIGYGVIHLQDASRVIYKDDRWEFENAPNNIIRFDSAPGKVSIDTLPGAGEVSHYIEIHPKIVDMILDIPYEDRDWDILSELPLTMEDIIEIHNSDNRFNWFKLSANANISLSDTIETLHDSRFQWDFNGLTVNKNILLDEIMSNPDLPWNWESLLAEEEEIRVITLRYIIGTVDDPRYQWNWIDVSSNSGISFRDIERTLDDPRFRWDWNEISFNPNITFSDVERTINNPKYQWELDILASNPSISENDIIKSFDDSRFEWYIYNNSIMSNPNVGMGILRKLIERGVEFDKIDWTHSISLNKNISWNEIKQTLRDPRYKWDWTRLTMRTDIEFREIEETMDHPYYKWFKPFISRYSNATIDDIERTARDPRFHWSIFGIVENPNFTPHDMDRLLINPHINIDVPDRQNFREVLNDPYDFSDNRKSLGRTLSENPNFTYSVVKSEYSDLGIPWNWNVLLVNEINKLKEDPITKSASKV